MQPTTAETTIDAITNAITDYHIFRHRTAVLIRDALDDLAWHATAVARHETLASALDRIDSEDRCGGLRGAFLFALRLHSKQASATEIHWALVTRPWEEREPNAPWTWRNVGE